MPLKSPKEADTAITMSYPNYESYIPAYGSGLCHVVLSYKSYTFLKASTYF